MWALDSGLEPQRLVNYQAVQTMATAMEQGSADLIKQLPQYW